MELISDPVHTSAPIPRRRILTVVGARPNFIKAGVVSRALHRSPHLEEILIHTGQHYDARMSDVFFRELEIPEPHRNLNIGSEPPTLQLAHMLERLAHVLDEFAPDAVLVYGDTNSTLSATLAAAQRDIPVIHVEAGERIHRRREMPEEYNRVLVDNSAALCLTSTRRARHHLLREGFAAERVRFAGDPLYDLFLWARPRLAELATLSLDALGLRPGEYHLATIHRVQNTRDKATLLGLLETLDASRWPVVMPVHPRVRNLLATWGWQPSGSLQFIEPAGYFDFMRLLVDCRCVFTDSGGATREAFFARRPCVVPMPCYWADAVEHGWMLQTSLDRTEILEKLDLFPTPAEPEEDFFGDGHAAERIVTEIENFFKAAPLTERWAQYPGLAGDPPTQPVPFSHAAWRELLARLKAQGYRFALMSEIAAMLGQGRSASPFALLRHEIDFDPALALPLARIEAEAGARATYFVSVRSDRYNIFSQANSEALREILALGHGLGLICPAAEDEDYAESARRDAALIEQWFGKPVTVLQTRMATGADPGETIRPEFSLPHTGLPLFSREIPCFSDASGDWQPESPLAGEAFQQRRPIQIITHPVFWNAAPLSPNEALLRVVDTRQEAIACRLIRE